ncbi:LOW QUALITY PROTEIN: uncharacterized protein LOC104417348 [Eucalyptus grandis]|uniref:LOW QUALITY PROTEIN: uncharacterized protein LOC104417348 n=1 Tax=Eucalyptus grandis TaxID=71139 RepID=UPI00192E8B9F|nr:LOW QUALITY PROTEIN: uncharacterized protein LOC104417348 [Eucalyptus grandis]
MGNEASGDEGLKTNNLSLYPVKHNSSGEGLPYAPVDWPNPGDTWYWWVGNRTSRSGFYRDRLLYLPKRLHGQGCNSRFASKCSLEHYISLQFPNADVNEFFASFSWMVPSTRHYSRKEKILIVHLPVLMENLFATFSEVPMDEIVSKRREGAPCSSKRIKKAGPATSQAFPRHKTRQSFKMPAQANIRNDESVIDLCTLEDGSTSDGSEYSGSVSESHIDLEDVAPDQSTGSSCYAPNASKAQDVRKVEEIHAQFCGEDIDECLKSLEHILSQHNDEAQVQTPLAYVGSDMAEELSTNRKKLSSILALDFSCVLSSKYLEEISYSIEDLPTDPILTVDQLRKLKIVQEISKASEVSLHCKGIAEQAHKFFGAIKDHVCSIKREVSKLKKGAGELELESHVESNSSLVEEIDEQIAQLQSRRAEIAKLKLTNKEKDQVVAQQKILANSLSTVVQEIQTASTEIPIWEMKKKTAEKEMSEILARYAHLKGLFFEKLG